MKIQILEGYGITQTERKSIAQMLTQGMTSARNRPNTKTYCIIQGWPTLKEYVVRIGTFATWTIGANPSWNYSQVKIKIS